jgi:selenide,water dikinase
VNVDGQTRLTQYAHGGGCACKIPPGELEAVVSGLVGDDAPAGPGELLVGLDDGDDAAVVRIAGGTALVATADFFTPVVDDAYDWGRIAAAAGQRSDHLAVLMKSRDALPP